MKLFASAAIVLLALVSSQSYAGKPAPRFATTTGMR